MACTVQRALFLVMSACHTILKTGCSPMDAKHLGLSQRRKRFIPDSQRGTTVNTPEPFPEGDPASHWMRNRSSVPGPVSLSREWATWAVDKLRDASNSDSSEQGSWASLVEHEDKLLATLVTIPLSMIVLFLVISWYRRNKSRQRRRRDRLRRRHIIEPNVIRRQLASQNSNTASSHPDSGVGPSESDHQGSVQSLSVFNPPSYSEALDTTLYPLVVQSSDTEDLPAYCDVARESLEHDNSRGSPALSEYGVTEDSPLTEHVRTFCVVESPFTPSECEMGIDLCDRVPRDISINREELRTISHYSSPPSYSDVFPHIGLTSCEL